MNDMIVLVAQTFIPPLGIACAIAIVVNMCFSAFAGRW